MGRTTAQTCVGTNVDALNLGVLSNPREIFHPELVEGDLTLASIVDSNRSIVQASNGVGGCTSGSAGDLCSDWTGALVWNVSTLEQSLEMIDWTIFPSNGLLLPGHRYRYGRCDIPASSTRRPHLLISKLRRFSLVLNTPSVHAHVFYFLARIPLALTAGVVDAVNTYGARGFRYPDCRF